MASRIILATCSLAQRWMKSLDPDNGHYPLGIAYLHATLERAGHEVQMQFLNHMPHEECLATIMDQTATFGPHILGLSIISDSRVSSFRVIEAVHERHPDIQIVLGGARHHHERADRPAFSLLHALFG